MIREVPAIILILIDFPIIFLEFINDGVLIFFFIEEIFKDLYCFFNKMSHLFFIYLGVLANDFIFSLNF